MPTSFSLWNSIEFYGIFPTKFRSTDDFFKINMVHKIVIEFFKNTTQYKVGNVANFVLAVP